LRNEGFRVSVLDCYLEKSSQYIQIDRGLYRIGLSDEEISRRIKKFGPDVIGISISFSKQFRSTINLVQSIRNLFPQIPIVAGGAHVSAAPESLNDSEFDYLIIGEGEKAFPELVLHLSGNAGPDAAVPGVFYRDYNHIFTTSLPCKFIADLDNLPFPAYDLMPLTKAWSKRVPYANIIATRGCPHNCSFCSIHPVMGRSLRRRSIENIISEIELLYNKYAVREVFFEDDNLTSNTAWAKELFHNLSRLRMGIEIGVRNGIRADRIDKELLELMHKAGCSRVCFAPESGSQRVLNEVIGKNLELAKVEEAVILARSVGLNVTCFFVVGLPGESKDDIQKTIDFATKLRRLGCDSIDINCATPYPGTRLCSECATKNYINEKLDHSRLHSGISVISTPEFTADEISLYRHEAMRNLKESLFEKIKRGILSFIKQPLLFIKRKMRRYFYIFCK
jgi:radical SAM superfamily enzyme YgiQ (UPF0313 family)